MQNTKDKNQQSKSCEKNFKEILDQAKQSINFNKKLHPNVILVTSFHKPA